MKHNSRRQQQLERSLAQAANYPEWQQIATELDVLTDMNQWKQDNASPYYDSELIAARLTRLRRYRLERRDQDLMRALREGLYHDLGNIGHPLLYGVAHIGTKKLIEDYIDQVCQCLNYLCDQQFDFLTLEQKTRFFEDTAHSYGQPALMFSGGATLGLFHAGVCKALQEQDLLPQVFSGSSAGSLMAGMLGTRTDAELLSMYDGDGFYDHAFHFRGIRDLLKGGGLADVKALKNFLRANLGEYTFEEAFARTGRHINIAIAPYDGKQQPRVMNELTSPYLLVWSAALASCAVPVLFPPVKLTAKRTDGSYQPYMSSTRWVDGSVRSDFPRERIGRLYNINYTIACQVNPHIVPFMKNDRARFRTDVLSWPDRIIRKQGQMLAMGVMDFARERLGRVAPVRRILDHGYGIIGQRYYGDVNIVGDYSLRHYAYMLQDPKRKLFQRLMKEGERATWPKISMIATHAKIGKTLEHCLDRLAQQRITAQLGASSVPIQTTSGEGSLPMAERRRHQSQLS